MKMFGKRKIKVEHYDRENLRPVIRASICTGEQVAGFKNIHTGKFEDVMLIRDNRDIEEFLRRYDIATEEVTKEY
ncbi:MAG: aspartate dehydrogenase [Lachnospiraceae bacterium]|nr:aspartate dehydrogenase [Lachnospiraceae bacterium]MBD5509870.1 aspartate dehydrogenase [Lachnospiraceae bacterium]